jgi:hypothetical protein
VTAKTWVRGGQSPVGAQSRSAAADPLPFITDPASDYCQRWRDHEHSWRHRSEGGFDASRYHVDLVWGDSEAKPFVVQHHYSGTYPAVRVRALLSERETVVGVATLGIPMQKAVLTGPFPNLEPYVESLELSRFVLLDRVPANSETWFLARVFRLAAAEGVRGVVSFADPRHGHVGTIYQAGNGLHTASRGRARILLVGPDGRTFSDRALSKIRSGDRGHEYAERQLVAWGARPRRAAERADAWLLDALNDARVSRVRHPGNYRYLFRLGTKADRSRTVIGLPTAPYPKAAPA